MSALAIAIVWRRISSCSAFGSEYGGSEQAESPEWMPACLDMLHDAADHHVGARR